MNHKAIALFLVNNSTARQTVEIIEALLNEESPTAISKRFGVQRAWVYKVKDKYLNEEKATK